MFARMRFTSSAWIALAAVLMVPGCQYTGGKKSPSANGLDATTPDAPLVDDPNAPIEAATYIAAGRLHESQGRDLQAVQQYRRAFKTCPNDVDTLNRLGMALSRLGGFREAADAFSIAIQLAPEKAHLHNNLAFVYICQSRWQEAEIELVRALELTPDFARGRVNLGMALAQQDRFDEAFEQFRLVLPVAEAHFNVGLMHQSKRQMVEAAQEFKLALEANPELVAARKRLDMMPAEIISAAEQKLKEAEEARALAAAQAEAEALAAAAAAEAEARAAEEAEARAAAEAEALTAAQAAHEATAAAIADSELSMDDEAGALPMVQPAAFMGTIPTIQPGFADEEWFYPIDWPEKQDRKDNALPALAPPANQPAPAASLSQFRRTAEVFAGMSRSLHDWIAPLAERIDQRFRDTLPPRFLERFPGMNGDDTVPPNEPVETLDPVIAQ